MKLYWDYDEWYQPFGKKKKSYNDKEIEVSDEFGERYLKARKEFETVSDMLIKRVEKSK